MSTNNEQDAAKPQGGGGALFARSDNLRSDARLAAQMISLGVIELEEAKELLRMGFALAKKAGIAGRGREFAALMQVPLAVAKLEQAERHKMIDKALPDKHEHTHHQGEIVRQVLNEIEDDERLDRLAEEDAISIHASYMGDGSIEGQVDAGESPAAHQPSRNGHHPGSNGQTHSGH